MRSKYGPRPGPAIRTVQGRSVAALVAAGLSYRKAAAALGLTPSTAWRLHHRFGQAADHGRS